MTGPFAPSRRVILLGAAAAAISECGAALAQQPVSVAPALQPALAVAPYASWFGHSPDLAKQWRFESFEGDNLRLRVTPTATEPTLKVLALYPRASSAYDVAISKMLNVFAGKKLGVDMTVINFKLDDQRGQFAIGVAATGNFDLILAMGSESTAWLWKHYRGGRIPVLTVCSKDPVILGQAKGYDRGSNTNFAFTSLNMPLDVQMAYMMQLRPNLKNLGVLVDSRNVSAVETQAKPVAESASTRGIRVLELSVLDPANAKAELQVLVKDAVARMQRNDVNLENSLFFITGSTSVFKEIATITAHSSRVPLLSAVPEVVQAGDDSATLSIGVSFESNAHQAAVYADDILSRRRSAGALPVGIVSPPDIAINFRKAREVGLKIPFKFFESANTIFDYEGVLVRSEAS